MEKKVIPGRKDERTKTPDFARMQPPHRQTTETAGMRSCVTQVPRGTDLLARPVFHTEPVHERRRITGELRVHQADIWVFDVSLLTDCPDFFCWWEVHVVHQTAIY